MQLHIRVIQISIDPLVVVMYCNREDFFGILLSYHIIIKNFFYFCRFEQFMLKFFSMLILIFFLHYFIAEVNAFVTNVDRWPCNYFLYFFLCFPTKRATQESIFYCIHSRSPFILPSVFCFALPRQ